ncbi:MAG: type I-E CRISPR-associated protein Cas5/CasD [Bacteroidetes bacterium]|nr:type I-E CRISPR-associated protein Cas5/CasD [Bacteroidota bacterium]
MKHTLLIRLQGPMQSWGLFGRFTIRDSSQFPTKSGVLGIVAAAMGIERGKIPEDLCSLTLGIKVMSYGKISRDFHTAMDVIKADGKKGDTVVSNRYYLNDAWFIAGVSGYDEKLLIDIFESLKRPVWPIYLGRKSCPPAYPIHLSAPIQDNLLNCLRDFRDPLFPESMKADNTIWIEASEISDDSFKSGSIQIVNDQPVADMDRYFIPRKIIHLKID